MLDERQIKAIELLIAGEETKTDIAKIIGISRQTLYSWMSDGEFIAEMDKRLQDIKTQAQKTFDARLDKAVNEYWKLAMTTTDVRTKQIALSGWIDRCLGRATSRVEMSDNKEQDKINEDDLLANIERFNEEDDGDVPFKLVK